MDTPCHVLTGFVFGQATQAEDEEKWTRPGPLFTTLVSVLPDADFFTRWFGMSTYLTYHRAVLNSVFLLPVFILLFAAAYRWWRGRVSFRSYLVVGLMVGGLHVFMDLWNTFGNPIFFPFSFERYAIDLVFIVDVYVYAFLLVPIVVRFIQGAWSPRPARIAFVLIGGYLLFSGINRFHALDQLDRFRARNGIDPSSVHRQGVTPQPLFPMHWSLILQHTDGTRQAFVNTLSGQHYAEGERFDRDEEAFELLEQGIGYDRDARVFDWFARYPVVLHRTERDIVYGDLQFNVRVPPAVRDVLIGEDHTRTLPFRFRCRFGEDGRPAFQWLRDER